MQNEPIYPFESNVNCLIISFLFLVLLVELKTFQSLYTPFLFYENA